MNKSLLTIATFVLSASIHAQIITTIAGNGTLGYSGDSGAATAAEINQPTDVAFDQTGNMYIADYSNNRVRKVTPSGIISTFAGTGTYGYTGDGGSATAATLAGPAGVTFDAAGNLYISEQFNNTIRKVTTGGIISTVAGNGSTGYSGDGGQATSAALNGPYAVAFDATSNMYIVDANNSVIRKVATSGIISTIAGSAGVAYFGGDGGPATAAWLNTPTGIAISPVSGNIYIADGSNQRIRMINSSGIISTIAGDGMEQFSGDNGPAASAEFNMYYPSGLTFDGAGNLFIADGNNYRIRKINTSGIITTVVGDGIVAGYGGDGGPATAAGLNDPTGIRFDAAGNLFIADYNNNRIRKVTNIGQASGIEQLSNHETRIEIYPNPTTRILNIESTTLDASIDMQVTDMLGQAVMQITFQQGKSSIDVSSLPSGVYFIKGSQSVQKFIKQ